MKQIKLLRSGFYCAAIVILLVVVFQFNIYVRANQITLLVETGGVEVMNPLDPTKTFKPVSGKFLILVKNAVVRTNNGTAYMLLPGKSLISLDVFTSVELENANENSYVISSAYSRTWHKIQNQKPNNSYKYELNTPTARLESVETEFELKVGKEPESVSEVTLLQGQAFVTNSQTQAIHHIDKGKQAQIKEGDLDVKVQDTSKEITDSDFYKKNKIIGDKIDKMSATASLETYKTVIEAASNSAVSARTRDSLQIKSDTATDTTTAGIDNSTNAKSATQATQTPQFEPSIALTPASFQPPANNDTNPGDPINTNAPETLPKDSFDESQVIISHPAPSATTSPQSTSAAKESEVNPANPHNFVSSQSATE